MPSRKNASVLVLTCVLFSQAAAAGAATPDPWVLISPRFGGSSHSIGYQPQGSPAGTVYVGGDDGGAWRSQDCGTTWEPVDGGRPLSTGVGGGYPLAQNACAASNQSCVHGVA